MKIFIDANIFLDFYRSNKEAIKVFDEIIKNSSEIIITDQIIDEYYRNRETVLTTTKKQFQSESSIQNFPSSLLQTLKEYSELTTLLKQYNSKKKEIESILDTIITDYSKDIVAEHFNNLIKAGKITILKTDSSIISLAQQRKLKGNPPVSDKYSVGDEINWELLIRNVKEDLIIVARDNTFITNINFLKREFKNKTGKQILLLTDKITAALEELGKKTSEEIKHIEETQIDNLRGTSHRWRAVTESGNSIGVTDGRNFGYTFKDLRNVDLSFMCAYCGSYGPWSGARCLTCGHLSDD